MGLDVKEFLHQRFEARITEVAVPQLKQWFTNGDKPVWKVRSITADEIGRADEAVANEAITGKMLEALTSMNSSEVTKQVKELMGKSEDTPKTIAKRVYHLIYGSVDPKCDFELADKLRKNFPVIFYELTNAILTLTGQGFEPGKSKPSGKTKRSS
jgi:hypothetical protein